MKIQTDIRHELLSELHHLLSIASANDFTEASKLCKSQYIKRALEALALEHTSNLSQENLTQSSNEISIISQKNKSLALSSRFSESEILTLLLDMDRFPKKSDLVNFSKINGFALKVGSKEGRERVAGKIVKTIFSFPQDRRQKILDRLQEGVDTQTAGWARVIKRTS